MYFALVLFAINLFVCAALFTPYGRSIVITYEFLTIFANTESSPSISDTRQEYKLPFEVCSLQFDNHIEACKFLRLNPNCSDIDKINKRADKTILLWRQRFNDPNINPAYTSQLNILISNTENARSFLINQPDYLHDVD